MRALITSRLEYICAEIYPVFLNLRDPVRSHWMNMDSKEHYPYRHIFLHVSKPRELRIILVELARLLNARGRAKRTPPPLTKRACRFVQTYEPSTSTATS